MAPFQRQLPALDFSTPDKAGTLGALATGELCPVVERTFPLGEAADAMRYLQTGRVTGKVVLTAASAA